MEPRSPTATAVDALVGPLLGEIAPGSRLTEVTAAPAAHFTLRIKARGAEERRVILSHELVERAHQGVRSAVEALRSALRTQLGRPVAGTPVAGSSRYRSLVTAKVRCAMCQRRITLADHIVIRRAQVLHPDCEARQTAS